MSRAAGQEDCKMLANHFFELLIEVDGDASRTDAFEDVTNVINQVRYLKGINFTDDQMNAAWARAAGRATGSLIANLYENPSHSMDVDAIIKLYLNQLDSLIRGEN